MLTAIRIRSMRMALPAAAILAAGLVALIARPGIALAHHVMISDTADCAGWEAKAEYIGGSADRLAVVDVVINGEAISQSFYFDAHPGHLGHQDYYLLYDRSGIGPLQTSGTVTLYEKSHGNHYDIVADTDTTNIDLRCLTPTPTATATPRQADTPTPEATATVQLQGTITPLATDTPAPTETATDASATPQSTETAGGGGAATPVATTTATADSTNTAVATSTSTLTVGAQTPTTPGDGTPTLTSSVRGITHGDSSQSAPPPSGARRSLPSTGDGSDKRTAIVLLVFGMAVAIIGGIAFASGVRSKPD